MTKVQSEGTEGMVPSHNAQDPLVRIRGVSKTYYSSQGAVQALQAVDLEIHRGEFVSFVGPSGCGKSTLLNLMSALLEPSDGAVVFDGEELTEPSRDIGFMFQTPVLLPWRTI